MADQVTCVRQTLSMGGRKGMRPDLTAARRQEAILDCLKDTRCAMSPLEIKNRLYDSSFLPLTVKEVQRNLGILLGKDLVCRPDESAPFLYAYRKP